MSAAFLFIANGTNGRKFECFSFCVIGGLLFAWSNWKGRRDKSVSTQGGSISEKDWPMLYGCIILLMDIMSLLCFIAAVIVLFS